MLLVDDILLSPLRTVGWLCREMHQAAQQELAQEAAAITAKLSDLYRMFETGELTEAECDARERTLLDRLDRLQGHSLEVAEDVEDDAHSGITAPRSRGDEEDELGLVTSTCAS